MLFTNVTSCNWVHFPFVCVYLVNFGEQQQQLYRSKIKKAFIAQLLQYGFVLFGPSYLLYLAGQVDVDSCTLVHHLVRFMLIFKLDVTKHLLLGWGPQGFFGLLT